MKKEPNKLKNERTRDEYTVVLEDLRSNFKVFGEGLSLVRDNVDTLGKKVDNLKTKVDVLDRKVDKIDSRLEGVEGDLALLKGEVALIRHNQITRDEFRFLESRVLRLEQKMSR